MSRAFRRPSYPPDFWYPLIPSAPSIPHRAVRTRSNSGTIVTQARKDPRCGRVLNGLGTVGRLRDVAGTEPFDHLPQGFPRNPEVVAVVDLHDGRPVARSQTLHFFQGELSLGCRAFVCKEGVRLLVQLPAPEEGAGDVGAHGDEPLPRWLLLEHGVKGGHSLDFRGGETQDLGDLSHPVTRDVTFFRLDQVQERQERRSRVRVSSHQRVGFRPGFRRENAHQRSTPPITGSTLATEATTSATNRPRTISGSARRLQKEGSRTRTRYGRTPPLETT